MAHLLREGAGIVTTHFARLVPVVVCLFVGLSVAVHAKDPARAFIRPLHPLLAQILDAGYGRSATFRALVDRLEAGDVVVYMQYGQLPGDIQGRLSFLGAAAGRRYVLVELIRELEESRMIAIVGHELRHAVEVLEQPEIVDRARFALAYESTGFRRRQFAGGGTGFDTAAAIAAGQRIWRELAVTPFIVATR